MSNNHAIPLPIPITLTRKEKIICNILNLDKFTRFKSKNPLAFNSKYLQFNSFNKHTTPNNHPNGNKLELPNNAALLAFLNQLTAALGIQDLTSIEEASDLVPILIDFIKTGNLAFHCDPEPGKFSKATTFMSEQFGEAFVKHLNPEAADRGDHRESGMVLLALLYALRLARDQSFMELCAKLDEPNASRIAQMVEHLDGLDRWSQMPFGSVFDGQPLTPWPPIPAARKTLSNVECNKENAAAPSPPRPKTTTSNNNSPALRAAQNSTSSSSPSIWNNTNRASQLPMLRTPPTMLKSAERTIHAPRALNFDESPVQRVLRSPRGEEVVRIQELRTQVKRLREFNEALGRDKDQLDEQCKDKDAKILQQQEQINGLESRIARLLPLAERIPTLEDRILHLETNNNELEKEVRAMNIKVGSAEGNLGVVRFERDEAIVRLELKEVDFDQLLAENEQLLQQFRDEVALHEQTRKNLAESQERYNTEVRALKTRVHQLEGQLEEERKFGAERLSQKEREMQDHHEAINQIKEHSEEALQKAIQKEQKKANEAMAEFRDTLAQRNQEMAELTAALLEQNSIGQAQMERIGELEAKLEECKKYNTQLTRDHAIESNKLRKALMDREAQLEDAYKKLNALEDKLEEAEMKLENNKKEEDFETKYYEAREEIAHLRNRQTALNGRHVDEVNSLQRKIKELEKMNEAVQRTPSAVGRTPSVRTLRDVDLDGCGRTSSGIRVVYTPYRDERTKSRSAGALAAEAGAGTNHSASTAGSSMTQEDHDKRMRELRDRNRQYQPHLRSSYLPEAAHLKSSDPSLNI